MSFGPIQFRTEGFVVRGNDDCISEEEELELPTFSDEVESASEQQEGTSENALELPAFSEKSLCEFLDTSEIDDLKIPQFLPLRQPTATILPEDALDLPIFSNELLPSAMDASEADDLKIPQFSPLRQPTAVVLPEDTLDLPTFSNEPLPNAVDTSETDDLKIPQFSPLRQPTAVVLPKDTLDLPVFSNRALPDAVDTSEVDDLKIPQFSPLRQLTAVVLLEDALDLPTFSNKPSPNTVDIPKKDNLKIPFFLPHEPPKQRIESYKRSIRISTAPVDYHPVMKDFDLLSRLKSYEKIFKKAIRLGSLGDIRMFKHSRFEARYLNNVFEQLVEIAPSLLPQSSTFHFLLENDQEQLDLLTQFCYDLMQIDRLELLQLNPNPLVQRLVDCSMVNLKPNRAIASCSSSTSVDRQPEIENRASEEIDTVRQKGLLKLKDFFYCFLHEMLLQEQKASQAFGAVQKNITGLMTALPLLAAHIQNSADTLRMQAIRTAAELEFSTWEDRASLQHSLVRLENPGEEVEDHQLQIGLAAIQGEKPTVYQLKDFTHQVLSIVEGTEEEICKKARYLLQLGEVYAKLPTLTALKRSISWIDLAITTLSDRVDQNHPLLLECYELRGTVWQKMAKQLKEVSAYEKTLPRKRMDASYRDFHRSLPLTNGQEANFVRRVKIAKESNNLDLAHTELTEVVNVDEDYAEARYLDFLKQFEKLQLDSERRLHPFFESLMEVPSSRILKQFKELLLKKAHRKHGTFFKVTGVSGTAFLKWNSQGVFINRSGADFLISLLTHGIKKVQVVRSSEKKVYFCQPIAREQFCQIVQSLRDDEKRLEEVERSIHAFHAFEVAAFYKSSIKDEQDALDADSIRTRLNQSLLSRVVDLHAMAMNRYIHVGKSKEPAETKKCLAAALLHACRAIENCNRLIKNSDTQEIRARKLELLIKRGQIYKQMGLVNCYASDLEEAIAFGKKDCPRFFNPALHYALGCLYQELNRIEEAKEQFYIVRTPLRSASARAQGMIKKANKKLLEINQTVLPEKPSLPTEQDKVAILTEFQDKNIQEECLQILRDHYLANSQTHPHRNAPLWNAFIQRVDKTTTIKEFCETVFSSVLISEKVNSAHLLQIAKLSNLHFEDLKDLDQIKAYTKDAVKAYQEEEEQLQDEIMNKLEQAKAEVARVEAFFNFKARLSEKLKEGERIRPGSAVRRKIDDLASHLGGVEMDQETIFTALEEIIEEEISRDFHFREPDIKELTEILENALKIETSSRKIKKHVLQISGNNIFLSQVWKEITKARARDQTIHEVHINGIHVYWDRSIKLPGVNVAVGGQYFECLLDKKGRHPQPIVIDLSGKDGAHGALLERDRAADGNNPCDNGSDGLPGKDGEGGQCGGDFCIHVKEPIVGWNNVIIQQINLSGGKGGNGSNGQAGGNGAAGIKGIDARTTVEKGDKADTSWGHRDFRDGIKGRPGGAGGQGGNGGVGGKGGLSGRLIIKENVDHLRACMKTDNGSDGSDGQPGAGGKGGAGEPDGFDHVIVKGGGWIFASRSEKSGYELHCINERKDRDIDNWVDGTTREQTKTRNQGREKGRGKTAEEQARRRKEQNKNELKMELFAANLAHHLHTESAGNKACAFNEVTDSLAVAHETEEVVREQLAAKQSKIKDIETLHQTTASLLHQSETQQSAKIQHSRLASFTQTNKKVDQRQEIAVFFRHPERDRENRLPFHECSPVVHASESLIIHDLEVAMHEVNMTHAQNMPAIAKLVRELALFSQEGDYIESNRDRLLNRLVQVIGKMPDRLAVDGFYQLLEACQGVGGVLVETVREKALQIHAFQSKFENEKTSLNHAYEAKYQDITIRAGILRFLQSDRLLFSSLTHNLEESEKTQKKRWFDERLSQKVTSFVWQAFRKKTAEKGLKLQSMWDASKQEMIEPYLRYANKRIKQIQDAILAQDQAPSSAFKEAIASDRESVQKQLKILKQHQKWVLTHLSELVEMDIVPTKLLASGLKLENLYSQCSGKWASIPSQLLQEEELSSASSSGQSEKPTLSAQWISRIQTGECDSQKLVQLERHVKQLVDLQEELQEIDPYLEQLEMIYSEPDHEGLAEVFVQLVCAYKKMDVCCEILEELKSNCPKEIYYLRKNYLKILEDPSSQLQGLYKSADVYLQRRNIVLVKKECLEMLKMHIKHFEADKIDRFLNEWLLKANRLYRNKIFSPDTDFLAIFQQVIFQNRDLFNLQDESSSTQSSSDKPKEEDILHLILKQTAGGLLDPVDLDNHQQLIQHLQMALAENNRAKIRACLFALVHLELSYSETLNLIKIVGGQQLSENKELEYALALLLQKAEAHKVVFEQKWLGTIEQAKLYDQLRRQVHKDDQDSIERLLFQIAEEADLFASDEKVGILNQIMEIVSRQGCFTSISKLTSFRRQLVVKMGPFSTYRNGTNDHVLAYNRALQTTFTSDEKNISALSNLFMQAIGELVGSERRASSSSSSADPDAIFPVNTSKAEMTFCQNVFSSSLIAMNHLPLDSRELITLYKILDHFEEVFSDTEKEIKSSCLTRIRYLLAERLQREYETLSQEQERVRDRLLKEQTEITAQIAEAIKSSNVLHPERHMAKLDLWFKLLDFHFEMELHGDRSGVDRIERYACVSARFFECMQTLDTEQAVADFNRWLRESLNALKNIAVTPEYLESILRAIQEPNSEAAQAALSDLKRCYWRDTVPYSASEAELSLLGMLEDKRIDEETGKLLKCKFHDVMIQEECHQIKKELQAARKSNEKNLTEWIGHIQQRIFFDDISGEEMELIYPSQEMLVQVIAGHTVPVSIPQHRKDPLLSIDEEDLTFRQYIQLLHQKKSTPLFEAAVPKLHAYLQDLDQRIGYGYLSDEDALLLKEIKQLLGDIPNVAEMQQKIKDLELKLIASDDGKNLRKKEIVDNLIDVLRLVNSYKKPALEDSKDLFDCQILKELNQLKATIFSSCVLMDEELLLALVDRVTASLRARKKPINLQMLIHLFGVLPRLNQPSVFCEIIENKLPENWAIALLDIHCSEIIYPSLSQLAVQLPPLSLSNLSDPQKDEWIRTALKEKDKLCKDCFDSFKDARARLIADPLLRPRDKELLLRLLADRLALLNQGKQRFAIEEFTHIVSEYLASPCVLTILSKELQKSHSTIANALFQPSFESFKHVLKRAWIQGELEPAIFKLNAMERQKLFDGLSEIETIKKEETMREVVESLKGDLMTPAVVECIAHFAQGTWILDKETLAILKDRTASGKWYSKIEKYTKAQRSKELDLQALVSTMAQEIKGINSSIAHLLTGEGPQLVKDIQDIKRQCEEVSGWSKDEVTNWARAAKGEHIFDDPENLKRGIAIASRASKLIEGHSLRDTQLIALWLMLRTESGKERGRIGQMFTGEGKSITFACMAILRAMSRSYVDVITTSPILAARDAKNNESLFDLFELTVSNNCDSECESNEEERKNRYYRNGKPVDIIYGDVGAFERDLLLTEFHGQGIIHESRMGPNRSVLVDEVDGLFLDGAGMVLYLSHNVDTLRFLERIFAHIWTLVNHPSFEKALPFDDQAVEAIVKMMKEKMKANEIPLPKYKLTSAKYMEMKAVIARKLSTWVRSALYAKTLRVNNEYIITDQPVGGKIKKSITVMDKGTGVEQASLKWSNGLHQFLQFKHGLELAPESLKAVFLSNYFFFKRYGQHIYGLSGTPGSETEQKYLQQLYQVDICKIPRFKGERFVRYKDVVAGDTEEWLHCIETSVQRETKELKRAVLIICDSIEEAALIENRLKPLYPQLQTYTHSDREPSCVAGEKPTPVGPGDVIIATNLAGRGTDLKTTLLLEAYMGLHVILSYLPQNIRIQDQAFGRTARAGNEGSGEFIIMDLQRRPMTEQCAARDLEEKQRLENVAIKEVKKIEFENQLLRGFVHNGKKIIGFQSILKSTKAALKDEEPFYREAQLDSLKNRWAFWLDHMDEKITMVHSLGKEAVIASFIRFQEGIHADLHGGGFRLVKEPVELIKLGGEYRRKKMWSEAESCYDEAAKDPHYAYASYYAAACRLIKSPSSSVEAKQAFKKDAKKAALAIQSEISQLQTAIQNIAPLVEQRRIKTGEADFGNPYKARTEEKIQVWSIFLSAIDGAIGGTISEESLKKSSHIQGGEAREVLNALGEHYQPTRLSRKLSVTADAISHKGKALAVPKMFAPMLSQLHGVRHIDKQSLKECCRPIVTQESAREILQCPHRVVFKLSPIPESFEKWPSNMIQDASSSASSSSHQEEEYSAPNIDTIKFVLSSIVDELQYEIFSSHEEIKRKLNEKKAAYPLLAKVDFNRFFTALIDGKIIVEDFEIDLSHSIVKVEDPPLRFDSLKALKEGFTDRFHHLPEVLQKAFFSACSDKELGEFTTSLFLKKTVYLSELNLPKSTTEAAEILWTLLEEQNVIKPSRIKLYNHGFDQQKEKIKEDLTQFFQGREELEEVVKSVFDIIEGSFGAIYKLDDKKTTAQFADIIRKYFHDHRQHAPEGLNFFIELGLEAIADLIEKKDPPAWYEVLAVTVMGVIQMVAGAIIKAYVPIAGELIGNALISSGMDDVMFAITSAVNGQFSWSDYAAAKGESLKRSIVSSAISCGISFGVNSIQSGVGKAWDVQKLSGVEKAVEAGKIAPGAFNLGTHVLKEVGRSFLSMGISQIASRGLEGMTKLIAGSYDEKIQAGIANAVNAHWELVRIQSNALYDKLSGDGSIGANIQECMTFSLNKIQEAGFFDGVIRTSKQVLPQAGSLIGESGWASFISKYSANVANLGISIPKLINLVEDNVRQLAREVRATKDRKDAITSPNSVVSKEQFNRDLEAKKSQYVQQLTEAFKGVLNSAVYAPLVSIGTDALVKAGRDLLMPLSEQEQIAQSAKTLLEIMETENNPDKVFFDEALRHWRKADEEVKELTEEELQKTPVNAGESIKTLKLQYGNLLKIYKDKDGHLYAQRPTRAEYAQGIRDGKAGSDPEILALSAIIKRDIVVSMPDGKTKTYCHDGKITASDSSQHRFDAVYLNMESNGEAGIGHVSLQGAGSSSDPPSYTGLNCLYDAVSQATGGVQGSQELRVKAADRLDNDESSKLFYHDWSLSSEPKEFVGKAPSNLGTRLYGALGAACALSEFVLGANLTFVTGGAAAAVGIPLMGHSYGNFKASFETMYTGQLVDPPLTQLLQHEVGLSHDAAQTTENIIGLIGTMGGSAILQATRSSALKFSEITMADWEAGKSFRSEMLPKQLQIYDKFWEKIAPQCRTPFSTWRRYTPQGDIKQVTTYDQFGKRYRQYDLIDPRRGAHQHNFTYGPKTLLGERSGHLPINE